MWRRTRPPGSHRLRCRTSKKTVPSPKWTALPHVWHLAHRPPGHAAQSRTDSSLSHNHSSSSALYAALHTCGCSAASDETCKTAALQHRLIVLLYNTNVLLLSTVLASTCSTYRQAVLVLLVDTCRTSSINIYIYLVLRYIYIYIYIYIYTILHVLAVSEKTAQGARLSEKSAASPRSTHEQPLQRWTEGVRHYEYMTRSAPAARAPLRAPLAARLRR